ncbi:MAG: acyl-CoA dehydrogenase family protein [Planctomycetes bacterium]|nr:acyl-CoA dehydrogenase family protein [Planctomycetota bacterium]
MTDLDTKPADPNAKANADNVDIIDMSKMSAEKRAALEVAEGAREQEWKHPSLASQLFMGQFAADMVRDFPDQTPEEKKIGDEYVEKVGAFLEANLDPEEVDATRTVPQKVIDGLFEMGAFAMKVPVKYGGMGFTQVNYNRVMMMVSSFCASTAVLLSAHQSIGVPQPLKLFGTEEQKQKYFPRFRTGTISAFALTEPSVGSDPSKMSTTATLTPDGTSWVINGEKLWCTNGPIAGLLVVMCKTPPKMVNGKERTQITALIVEGDAPGITIAHRCDFMGIRGIQNGLLRFKDVTVPRENVLWGEGKGLKLALTTLNTGRLTLPAACTGVAKQCLSICRRWGAQRQQWGLPIGQHEAGREKLAFISSTTLAMEAVSWLTSHWADRHDIDIRIEAAMAKLFCSEMAWKIADMTMQMRGGRGYERASSLKARGEEPYPVERIMRDTRINMIIEGTSEIMRLFLAREAMDPHLRLASDILAKHTPVGTKLKAGAKLASFYSGWYLNQWFNASLWRSHDEMGVLSDHYQFVEAASHRLARTIFHYMGLYRDKLERKQVLLGHLMEVGTELFAIAATCSYAKHLAKDETKGNSPLMLADYFARESARRVEGHFRALSDNDDALMNALGKTVCNGEHKWLEDGIRWIGPRE